MSSLNQRKPEPCKASTVEHLTYDFKDEEGKDVHLERTKAYVYLPYSTFPDVLMLPGHLPLGTGTIVLEMYIKKEQLRARANVDTFIIDPVKS